jgi:L-lysine exporter family protein LysE/ArgO
MFMPFSQGFGLGCGLIIAIGAQNAFVLSQAVRRNHHLTVAMICAFCDAVLITAGVMGVGALVDQNPWLLNALAWFGAAFVGWYGFLAFRSAMKGNSLEAGRSAKGSFKTVVLATLAVTLLNPHVYLDTVVLLGSISTQFANPGRYFFAAGAMCASVLWFFSLCLGGRLLAPVFKRPLAWRVLDSLVCLTMWFIAGSLIMRALEG